MPSELAAQALRRLDGPDDFVGEERRTPGGRERDKVLKTVAEGTDDQIVIVKAVEILRGVRARIDRWMVPEDASHDNGTISGAAAAFITRGQWEAARSAGALVVFYESEDDRVGKVFERATSLEQANETIHGEVDHARVIRLSGGITMSRAIPPHDFADYQKRMEAGKLGFGDEERGLINVDAMAIAIHDGGKWMEQGEVLPLMEFSESPNMQALHYGSALFEGIGCERSTDGEVCIFDLEGHYERIRQGALRFDLPMLTFEEFKTMAIKTVKANERFIPPAGKGRLYLRPNLYSIGPKIKVGNSKTTALVFTATPIGNASSYFGNVTDDVIFGVPTTRVRSAPGEVGYTKASGLYGPTIEAIRIMKELGLGGGGVAYVDRVMKGKGQQPNEAKFRETNASNLLFFEDLGSGLWKVVTAPLDSQDILAGRTRALVKEIVKEMGWEFEEKEVTWRDATLRKYAYAAGSGTAAYLTPIHAFQKVEIDSRENLGLIDEGELAECHGAEAQQDYREKHVGKKVGEVVHLLGRSPSKNPDKGELFPTPIKAIIERMETVKSGQAGELYEHLLTRVNRLAA
jgi:branched-chain amino acid aminotransferase